MLHTSPVLKLELAAFPCCRKVGLACQSAILQIFEQSPALREWLDTVIWIQSIVLQHWKLDYHLVLRTPMQRTVATSVCFWSAGYESNPLPADCIALILQLLHTFVMITGNLRHPLTCAMQLMGACLMTSTQVFVHLRQLGSYLANIYVCRTCVHDCPFVVGK